MAEEKRTRRLSLDEFKAMKDTPGVEAIAASLNGGTFMECHTRFYASTGIWIPELVPVFRKLDAALLTRELPSDLR
jgi:hypothetical protein